MAGFIGVIVGDGDGFGFDLEWVWFGFGWFFVQWPWIERVAGDRYMLVGVESNVAKFENFHRVEKKCLTIKTIDIIDFFDISISI